jgi:hypothetical protein
MAAAILAALAALEEQPAPPTRMPSRWATAGTLAAQGVGAARAHVTWRTADRVHRFGRGGAGIAGLFEE